VNIDKRNRTELKSYFVRNAIPTENNFAELVDGMLNQKDDGIYKPSGDPLSIEASGDATSQKKAINFYDSFADPDPKWVLSLNPRSDAADPASARAGFDIADSAGNSRLFIDSSNGRVGLGTNRPSDKLTVANGDMSLESGRYRRLKITSDDYWAGIELRTLENTEAGHPHIDFTHGAAENFGVRLHAPDNDHLQVNGNLKVTEGLEVKGTLSAEALSLGSLPVTHYNVGDGVKRTLSSSNTWGDFNDLKQTFTLSAETLVMAYYQIACHSQESHFCTRLMIDGVANWQTRSITGDTTFANPSSLWFGRLSAGSHTIKAQYRSPKAIITNPAGSDWETRILRVLVLGN
jgi:hypothetical protein